jgi:hypothetical protein
MRRWRPPLSAPTPFVSFDFIASGLRVPSSLVLDAPAANCSLTPASGYQRMANPAFARQYLRPERRISDSCPAGVDDRLSFVDDR